MFLIIAAVLFVLWLLGFIGNVGGGLINILIVAALISVIVYFIDGRRRRDI